MLPKRFVSPSGMPPNYAIYKKNVPLGTLILREAGGICCYKGNVLIPIRQLSSRELVWNQQ